MRRLMAGVGVGAVIALAVSGVSLTAPRTVLALSNSLELTPTMGWNDWNGNGCQNDAADIEANAAFVHQSGLQADGYRYIINDGCWNDMVGVDQPYYATGYNYATGTDTQATPAQPDPEGSPEATLPTPTAEEAACGVGVNGRGTGVAGSLGGIPKGQLFVNPYLFPPSSPCANDGIKIVATYVHSLGLKFGLWLDASDDWNGEEIDGSYGFDQEDASTFASWGVDFIKADWSGNATAPSNDPLPYGTASSPGAFGSQCGYVSSTYPYTGNLEPCGGSFPVLSQEQLAQLMYGALSVAVQSTGRPTVLNLCVHDAAALVQQWGAPVGNSWKSDLNIGPSFSSLVNMVNDVDQYAQYAGPDGFNDPDMLEVGNGMSPAEDQAEFSLWAELSAPLIMGANLAPSADVLAAEQRTNVDQYAPATAAAQDAYLLSIFGNKDVIAVDQDPLGQQASIVSFDGTHLILAKPLADGDTAVTLFNEGNTPALMSTTAAAIGMQQAGVLTLKDLWTKAVTESAGTISAFVQPHAAVMYRVSDRNPSLAYLLPPSTTLSVASSSPTIGASSQTTVTVSLTDNGAVGVRVLQLFLQVPAGWTAVRSARMHPRFLGPGETDTASFNVASGPASSPISTVTLTGVSRTVGPGALTESTAALPTSFISPVVAPYLTADTTTGPAALFGELGTSLAIDAAGTGVAAQTTRSAAADQYGAIYLRAAADENAVATVRVTASSTGRGAEAGVMMRNSVPGTPPEGVVLYLASSGRVVIAWDADGGSYVTDSTSSSAAPGTGVWLQLRRTGAGTYTGWYATSASGPWSEVGDTATVQGASAIQDAGVFTASGTAGAPSLAAFDAFTVTG